MEMAKKPDAKKEAPAAAKDAKPPAPEASKKKAELTKGAESVEEAEAKLAPDGADKKQAPG